jgi:uncharacterized protein (TIGR02453 family)
MSKPWFTPALFRFLRELARNNQRDWFLANKARYEEDVREPALQLIAALAGPLASVSPHLVANPAKVGGSLFRIQRDTRFHHGGEPYKPWLGMRLYHARRRDVHAPSFYIHLQPGACFVAAGLWRPEAPVLKQVREFIADNPEAWKRAAHSPAFAREFTLGGDSLTRPPRGYPADHPLIDDLKRKDFIAAQDFADSEALAPGFDRFLMTRIKRLAPLVDYLCAALDLEF